MGGFQTVEEDTFKFISMFIERLFPMYEVLQQ